MTIKRAPRAPFTEQACPRPRPSPLSPLLSPSSAARPLSLSSSVYLERCLILHIYPQLVPRPPQRTVWVIRLLGVTLSEVEHKSGHERLAVAVSLVVKGTGGGPAAKARPIKAEGHDE